MKNKINPPTNVIVTVDGTWQKWGRTLYGVVVVISWQTAKFWMQKSFLSIVDLQNE